MFVAREIEYELIKIENNLKTDRIDSKLLFSGDNKKHLNKIHKFYEVLDDET